MRSFICNLRAPAEFFIVVSLWFDPLLFGGCFLLPKFLQSGFWEVGNAYFIWGAIFRIMALAALVWIGNIRGWSLSKFGIKISWKGTGGGLVLAGVAYAASYCVWTIYGADYPFRASQQYCDDRPCDSCDYFDHDYQFGFRGGGGGRLFYPQVWPIRDVARDLGECRVADALPCALGGDRWTAWHFCDRADICICLLALETVVATCPRSYAP